MYKSCFIIHYLEANLLPILQEHFLNSKFQMTIESSVIGACPHLVVCFKFNINVSHKSHWLHLNIDIKPVKIVLIYLRIVSLHEMRKCPRYGLQLKKPHRELVMKVLAEA